MSGQPRRFYGKYRGRVENNIDPLQQGRVQISCPAVLGSGRMSWADPCVPYAGNGVGLFLVPPQGAHAWIEFEAGDPDYPILAGCFWGPNEVPASPAVEQVKMLKTDHVSLEIQDVPGAGGLTVSVSSPAVTMPMTITAAGSSLELSMGNATLTLNGVSVSLNGGALEVT